MFHTIQSTFIFFALNAAVIYSAAVSARKIFPEISTAEHVLLTANFSAAAIILITSGLGFAGHFNLPNVTTLVLLFFLTAVLITTRRKANAQINSNLNLTTGKIGGEHKLIRLLFCLTVVGLFIHWTLIFTWTLITPPAPWLDAYVYHLPMAAEWLQKHTIDVYPTPFGDLASGYSPANGELLYLWAMLPFHADYAAKCLQVIFLALCGICVFHIGRTIGLSRFFALLAAVPIFVTPGLEWQATSADADVIFTFFFLSCTMMLISYLKDRNIRRILPAGICLGMFIGTKYLGVIYFPIAAAAGIIVFREIFRRYGRRSFFYALSFIGGIILFGGVWYIRNFLLTGNFFYPMAVGIGKFIILPGAYRVTAMRNFIWSPSRLAEFLPSFRFEFSIPLLIWLIVSVAGLLVLRKIKKRGNEIFDSGAKSGDVGVCRCGGVRMFKNINFHTSALPHFRTSTLHLIIFAGAISVFLMAPMNTQGRFYFPVVSLCFVLTGLFLQNLPFPAWLGGIAGLVIYMTIFLRYSHLNGARHLLLNTIMFREKWFLGPYRGEIFLTMTSIALLGIFFWVTFAKTYKWFKEKYALKVIPKIFLILSIVCITTALVRLQQHPVEHHYRLLSGIRFCQAWYFMEKNFPHPMKVAYTGTRLRYPLYGRRLQNSVQYININQHPHWQLHDYTRRQHNLAAVPSENPARREKNAQAWLHNLRLFNIDVLFLVREQGTIPIEAHWVDQYPDIFQKIFQSNETYIYLINKAKLQTK